MSLVHGGSSAISERMYDGKALTLMTRFVELHSTTLGLRSMRQMSARHERLMQGLWGVRCWTVRDVELGFDHRGKANQEKRY